MCFFRSLSVVKNFSHRLQLNVSPLCSRKCARSLYMHKAAEGGEQSLRSTTQQTTIVSSGIYFVSGCKPVARVERLIAVLNGAVVRFDFRVDTCVNLQTVRRQEGFRAAGLDAFEAVFACVECAGELLCRRFCRPMGNIVKKRYLGASSNVSSDCQRCCNCACISRNCSDTEPSIDRHRRSPTLPIIIVYQIINKII